MKKLSELLVGCVELGITPDAETILAWKRAAEALEAENARPIPAQQSPAVGSEWSYGEDNDGWYVERNDNQFCYCMAEEDASYLVGILNGQTPRTTEQDDKTISSNTSEWSQRVTEQDALAIAKSLEPFFDNTTQSFDLPAWHGRVLWPLLDKLNGDKS